MLDAWLEAWWTNHRLTRSLLDAVEDAGLACTLSRHGGRDVARQFAHVHDNRVAQVVNKFPRPFGLFGQVTEITARDCPITPITFDVGQMLFVGTAQPRHGFFAL